MAMSNAPILNADKVTATSGREVAKATNTVPTKLRCQPMATAKCSAVTGSLMAIKTTTTAARK